MRANGGEVGMSKMRSRLGRGLSSLLSVSEEEALTAPPPAGAESPGNAASEGQSAVESHPPAVLGGHSPGGLPVMRALRPPKTAESEGESPCAAEMAADGIAGHLPDSPRLVSLSVTTVQPNPHQPRKQFDDHRLQELAASVKVSGVIQPIVVRPSPTDAGQYELIAGERRWRAAKLAGLAMIPAIVRQADPAAQARLALIENVQREDLNPIERAVAYAELLKASGSTQAELAGQLGEDRSSIANFLRLLDLAGDVQRLIAVGHLSAGHGKVLAGVSDMAEQQRLAELAVSRGLSVRALEELIKKGSATPPPAAGDLGTSAHLLDLEKSISRQLGMRVQVRSAGKNPKKGKLVVHYSSLDQFDQLLDRLNVRVEEV